MSSCIVTRSIEGGFERISFAWQTDSSGKCVHLLPDDLAGTLYRFESWHKGSGLAGTTYSIKLLDGLGLDVLMGQSEHLAYNVVSTKVISLGSPEGESVLVAVGGRYRFEVDAGEDKWT